MQTVKQKLIVRTTDRQKYVDTIIELSTKGAKRSYGTVPRMVVPFTCEMEIMVSGPADALKSTACIIALPVEYDAYTESELESMVWDEFREAVGTAGIKGRDRKKMTEDYLDAIKNKR